MNRRDIDRILESELRRPVGSPDLTRNIMGRLGYMQATPAVSRRRCMQRWLGRASLLCTTFVVGWLGVMAFQASPEARRPMESTIPSAIHSDLQQQQNQINSVIQLLRELPPRLSAPVGEEGEILYIDEEIDQSAVAPVRWV